jgi:hypothetical protein
MTLKQIIGEPLNGIHYPFDTPTHKFGGNSELMNIELRDNYAQSNSLHSRGLTTETVNFVCIHFSEHIPRVNELRLWHQKEKRNWFIYEFYKNKKKKMKKQWAKMGQLNFTPLYIRFRGVAPALN